MAVIDRFKNFSVFMILFLQVVDEQQKLIVITTFNLIVVYFTYRSYLNQNVNLFDLQRGKFKI